MLNQLNLAQPFIMAPDGSLNKLPVSAHLLHVNDPLSRRDSLTGYDLVSSAALSALLVHLNHESQHDLRAFITHFSMYSLRDHQVLTLFAYRFNAVVKTAKDPKSWGEKSQFLSQLGQFWQSADTIIVAGGLTTSEFGIQLALLCEQLNNQINVISSHWGGSTALYGMAQTVSKKEEVLVIDFGATGVKRGVSINYGNKIDFLPSLLTADFKENGRIDAGPFKKILDKTRQELGRRIPVAISIACYLNNGHPFSYSSGVYYNIAKDVNHLATEINNVWLPELGLGRLELLVHDSTAAALAFRVKQSAMMITLGTGLGSAPCPLEQ